jgi:hypothetical protein
MNRLNSQRAEQWRRTIGHIRDCAARLQAAADDLPWDMTYQTCSKTADVVSRHASAFADYTVALNCMHMLMLNR